MSLILIIFFVSCFIIGFGKGLVDYEIKTERVAETSWNKYKKDKRPAPIKGLYGWYHKKANLIFMERFLFSATALVFLTDLFHLGYTIKKFGIIGVLITSILIGVSLPTTIAIFSLTMSLTKFIIILTLVFIVLYQIGFYIWYNFLGRKIM